jgi:hypothetical protein
VHQQTVARITLSIDLPHHCKGIHMRRILEVLEGHRGEVTLRTIPGIVAELRRRLEAELAASLGEGRGWTARRWWRIVCSTPPRRQGGLCDLAFWGTEM